MGEHKLLFSIVLVAAAGAFSFAQNGQTRALTLTDCYRIALGTSESVLSRSQVMKEADARYRQAVGTVLPHVSYAYELMHQDIIPGSNLPSYIAYPDSIQSRLTLTQPLFAGLREYAGISASRSERLQRQLEEVRARQTLLSDVSDAFFTLVEQREVLKILNDIHTAIQEQINYLNERVRVGRSRRSDVSGMVVILCQNEALIESARGLEADTLKRLEFVTGIAVIGEVDDTMPLPQIGDERSYTDTAYRRPDIVALQQAFDITRKNVQIARSGFLPSVDLSGNYYLRRTGQFADIGWDATLLLEVPLLPVVQTQGSVREAAAKAEEARLQWELQKRSALADIQSAYADARAAIAQQEAYRRALAAAEDNFRIQVSDYRLNLVNNLDVLSAIQSLQTARRDYVHAVYNTKRLYWRLKVAAGDSL